MCQVHNHPQENFFFIEICQIQRFPQAETLHGAQTPQMIALELVHKHLRQARRTIERRYKNAGMRLQRSELERNRAYFPRDIFDSSQLHSLVFRHSSWQLLIGPLAESQRKS